MRGKSFRRTIDGNIEIYFVDDSICYVANNSTNQITLSTYTTPELRGSVSGSNRFYIRIGTSNEYYYFAPADYLSDTTDQPINYEPFSQKITELVGKTFIFQGSSSLGGIRFEDPENYSSFSRLGVSTFKYYCSTKLVYLSGKTYIYDSINKTLVNSRFDFYTFTP